MILILQLSLLIFKLFIPLQHFKLTDVFNVNKYVIVKLPIHFISMN